MTVSSDCRHRFEPLFDIHPVTGASIEVFYAVGLATFGRGGAGWFGGLASAASPQRAQRLARSLRAMERTGMRWLTAFKMTVGINCSCPSNLVRLLTRCLPGQFQGKDEIQPLILLSRQSE